MSRNITIFVSYSHQDAEYLQGKNSLLDFLQGLKGEGAEFWWDEKIETGELWDDEIKAKIAESDIALVLVSHAFLNSPYCKNVEIRQFLDQKTLIFPVILSACLWQDHEWLRERQFLPSGDQTVEEHFVERGARKRLYLKIYQQLRSWIEKLGKQGPSRPTPLDDLAPGKEIGPEDNRFRLVKEIGSGGMGRIWLARDLEEEALEGYECYKALKVVNPMLQQAPKALDDLKREAIRASRLAHPHIVNVYGWRQGKDDWPFVVMEYLQGKDLDWLLFKQGRLGWERTLALLRPMAEALDYAHQRRCLVHRDLKPGNVFITDLDEVKLLDFGLAYRLRQSSRYLGDQDLSSGGTPEYMPPEAFVAGRAEPVQDIYALACMVYEMLTGEPPYKPEAAVQRRPDLFPEKPEALTDAAWDVLKAGFAYRKQDRPGSAGELVRQLVEAQRVSIQIPDWADAVSEDEYGRYADFSIKGVCQRMRWIAPGKFLMGSPESEARRYHDEVQHRVVLTRGFWLADTACAQALWQAVMGDNPSRFKGEERPVEQVSWEDVRRFLERLNAVVTGQGFRLPTEAEWEYACRAGTTTPFWFGDQITLEQVNYNGNNPYAGGKKGQYREETVDVKALPCNSWGLYQMHGNVWEWCQDWKRNYDLNVVEDPAGPAGGRARVLRGGGWIHDGGAARSAQRGAYGPALRLDLIGFRLARGQPSGQ